MHATQLQGTTSPEPTRRVEPETTSAPECRCGDNGCDDTFGRATAGQDRSECCQYCGYYDCDVCGWADPTRTVTGAPRYLVTESGLQALDGAIPGEAPGTAAPVLRDAALYLERHGWIKGAYYDSTTGSFTPAACLVGAIGMVCYGGPVDAPAQHFDDPGFLDFEEAVLHLDRFLLVENSSEAYAFNDAQGRTVEQVTDVLRKAAARPAEELIDALRVIDAKSAEVAAIAELLKPCGIWGDTPSDSVDGGEGALVGGDVE